MCGSDARGFGSPEAVVGAALGLVAVLAALAAAAGLARLGGTAADGAAQALAAHWALGRLAREAARAGRGVCVDGAPACPDEAIEFLGPSAVALRGDLDGDDPARGAVPERHLSTGAPVPTANDEVVVYLLRPRGTDRTTLAFDADLDGSDRVTLADGTLLARRDGVVAPVDAGPCAPSADAVEGTLYRVTFVHDARHAGTGRFRVVEPLCDDVVRFAVTGRDAAGAAVGPCGGADDAAGRACRAALRRLDVELVLSAPAGERRVFRRSIRLGLAAEAGP